MKLTILLCAILISVNAGAYKKVATIGYDSTYVLAIKQKFAIPENVINGDYVGTWKKTYTWRSGNSTSYSIKSNFRSAFSINSKTGLITVKDASKIKGKVYQQDTVINIIIQTIDADEYYEEDTCEISVKESKFCKFIDYSFTGEEKGTRLNPYNNLSDLKIKAGYGYFIKRGNKIYKTHYNIPGIRATENNPTVFASYSSGDNPIFNGAGLVAGIEAFEFENTPYPSQYCRIYNIDVANYPSMAFRISARSRSFGIYNCNFFNNVNVDYKYDLGDIYFTGAPEDTLINWQHELINLESKGSWGPIVKSDASGLTAYNIKSATANNLPHKSFNYRLAISYYSKLSHFWFIGGSRSLQVRYPDVIITDGIITGSKEAGMFLLKDWTWKGNFKNLKIVNVLFRNNENGIYTYDADINQIIIENCKFEANDYNGIYFRKGGSDRIIRNCIFKNNMCNGVEFDNDEKPSRNISITNCIFYGNKTGAINARKLGCANNIKIINNTVIGEVDLIGSENEEVRNNFFVALRGANFASNNISLDSIRLDEYFKDPANQDYRLKLNTTTPNLKKSNQYQVLSKSEPDIVGAYEY